jgi:hypothetical protein
MKKFLPKFAIVIVFFIEKRGFVKSFTVQKLDCGRKSKGLFNRSLSLSG